jgi:hypothetical protein
VAILLIYAMARLLLAGEQGKGGVHRQRPCARGLKRSSRFETTKQAKLMFRTLLTEGASEVELALILRLAPVVAHGTSYKICSQKFGCSITGQVFLKCFYEARKLAK